MTPPTFNFLIAGCGYVGRALARSLLADGHRVWALRRDHMPCEYDGAHHALHHTECNRVPQPATRDPQPTWLRGDLSQPATLPAFPPVLDGVFYTAAASRAKGDDPFPVYADGPRHLVTVLREQSVTVRRFLMVSSTGVYGQTKGEWVDETAPAHPRLPAGQAMLVGEAAIRALDCPTVVLRFSGIYGPGRVRMLRLATESRPVLPAAEPIYLNHLHLDDCVGALRHLHALPDPAPLYNVSDEQPATRLEVLSWLARRAGAPPPLVDPNLQPRPRQRGNKRVEASLLRRSGYSFRHPSYRDGYAQLLANPSDPLHLAT